MPVERFTMYHDNGGEAVTTQRAYEGVWKAKGWRKTPKNAKAAPPPEDSDTES